MCVVERGDQAVTSATGHGTTDYKDAYYRLVDQVRSLKVVRMRPLKWECARAGSTTIWTAKTAAIDFTITKTRRKCTMTYGGYKESFPGVKEAQRYAATYAMTVIFGLLTVELEVIEDIDDQTSFSI